jgi:hypothetical protein
MMLGVACLVVSLVGTRVLMGYGLTFHGSFKKVQAGMSEAQVVAALGIAGARTTEFRLGQYIGFEKEYARAAASGSVYYLLWYKGIDVVYAVGFDNDGRVTTKAFGGT